MAVRSYTNWLIPIFLLISYGSCQPTLSSSNPALSNPSAEGNAELQWVEWNEETFRLAQEEDKLILLDLTAVWCHACHVMDETTYANPSIIALLKTKFIPLRVDTDQRPDIEARYRHGGWPTTSILLPTGEIVFQANFLEPDDLREALLESESLYRQNKQALLSNTVYCDPHSLCSESHLKQERTSTYCLFGT